MKPDAPSTEPTRATPKTPPLTPPDSPAAIFTALSILAMQAFGGALALAQDMMCERRRWLSRSQFLEMLTVAQLVPGPNMVNLSLMVGDHFFGLRGALAALAGLFAGPLVVALGLAAFFGNFIESPVVAGALKGIGAVAAGMIIGNALRLSGSLRDNPMGVTACAVLTVAAFVAAGILRFSLLWVIPLLGLVAVGWAWHALTRARNHRRERDE